MDRHERVYHRMRIVTEKTPGGEVYRIVPAGGPPVRIGRETGFPLRAEEETDRALWEERQKLLHRCYILALFRDAAPECHRVGLYRDDAEGKLWLAEIDTEEGAT